MPMITMNKKMVSGGDNPPTGATLFSGFEGVGIGMIAAGIQHVWGIEYDPAIAAVAQLNGFNTIVADILDCNPADLEAVDVLAGCPPCPSFSNAKANGAETALDIALAGKVAEFVGVLRPRFFILENVYKYRKSKSWGIIVKALRVGGYAFNYWHVNMASYGVPQTRKRMIVIARRDGLRPMLPPATHAENPQADFFGTLKPWVGWYEAIVDLIPSLPESKFADWQLKRLPDELRTMLVTQDHSDSNEVKKRSVQIRQVSESAAAVRASDSNALYLRAFIAPIQGEATNGFYDNEPAQTIAANHGAGKYRAFIVEGANSGHEVNRRDVDQPIQSITAADNKNPRRAYTDGRIVQMTTRALARFQSFPDWYTLPEQKKLACRGIGNAVPPLFAQRLFESLL